MDDLADGKDPALHAAIEALRASLGSTAFALIDHWPDDPTAIAVALPNDASTLGIPEQLRRLYSLDGLALL
jgi:hypothetical protein